MNKSKLINKIITITLGTCFATIPVFVTSCNTIDKRTNSTTHFVDVSEVFYDTKKYSLDKQGSAGDYSYCTNDVLNYSKTTFFNKFKNLGNINLNYITAIKFIFPDKRSSTWNFTSKSWTIKKSTSDSTKYAFYTQTNVEVREGDLKSEIVSQAGDFGDYVLYLSKLSMKTEGFCSSLSFDLSKADTPDSILLQNTLNNTIKNLRDLNFKI